MWLNSILYRLSSVYLFLLHCHLLSLFIVELTVCIPSLLVWMHYHQ